MAKKKSSTTAKKASSTTTTALQTNTRARTINEIVSIAETLDDECLKLLLERAKIIDTKGKIERFNRELHSAVEKAAKARRQAARPAYSVEVERTEDDFFIIQMDMIRVFFNRTEMRELTRICHAAKSEMVGARKLFAWFEKERSDLLSDAGINTERSPYLTNLYQVIVSTYKVKK